MSRPNHLSSSGTGGGGHQPATSLSVKDIISMAKDDGSKWGAPEMLQKLLITWVNFRLNKSGKHSSLTRLAEFRDKHVFHRALFAILGEPISPSNGTSGKSEEELSEDEWSLLEKHGITLLGVTREKIEKDFASGMAMLWRLFTAIQTKIFFKLHAAGAPPAPNLRSGLLQWFSACITSVDSSLVVKDLHNSWPKNNGRLFRALARALPLEEVQVSARDSDTAPLASVLQLIKDALHLGTYRMLTKDDFAIKESNRSQQAMLVHLALIHEQFLTLAPKFCSTLVLEAPTGELSEREFLVRKIRFCRSHYDKLRPEDISVSVSGIAKTEVKSKTLGIYFDELLTEANGICKDDSEECMTIRLAAVDLVARWLVKRSLFFDKLLSEIVSLNLASLQGERARCVEVKEDIQSQLPTEARKLPGMYALCTEAVARLNMAYRDTCQQEHYVERYLQRYVAFTSEDGARRHLLSVFPAYREEADRCRKLREEYLKWMKGMTSACQLLEHLSDVEKVVKELREKIDMVGSYDDLRNYLDRRKALLEQVKGFDERLQTSQEDILVYLNDESSMSVKIRIEQGHYDLSQLTTQHQTDRHSNWSSVIAECEMFRPYLLQPDQEKDMTELNRLSGKLANLEKNWAGKGDNSNPSMCISSQIFLIRQALTDLSNHKELKSLMGELGTLTRSIKTALEAQSSSIREDLGFQRFQAELKALQDLERLYDTLRDHLDKIKSLARRSSSDVVDGGEMPASVKPQEALCEEVKKFVPGRKKRLEFYATSRPLEDDLMKASSFLASVKKYSGPLEHVKSQLEEVQVYKQEKSKKLQESFNLLSQVAEELTSLVPQHEYDQEEKILHNLEATLNDVVKECENNFEQLTTAVGLWENFTEEVEQLQDEVNGLYSNVIEVIEQVDEPSEDLKSFAFEVQSIVSRQEHLMETCSKLRAQFRKQLCEGCKEADAEKIDENLEALMNTCESVERKARRLAIKPAIWIARAEQYLSDVKYWIVNDRGPTDLSRQQLLSLLELIPDVQESFQASHDQLPLKSSPDPRRMQESKGDDGDVFPKLKIDSGFAEPAESPKRPENPSLEDTVQPSPTSPSIQVTPVDSLSPCTPSDGSRTPGDNQLYLRTLSADAESDVEIKVKALASLLKQIEDAGNAWEVQANLHTELKRGLGKLENCVLRCEEVPDLPSAVSALAMVKGEMEKELPIMAECLEELMEKQSTAEPPDAPEAVQRVLVHWRNVRDQINARVCSVRLQLEEKCSYLERIIDQPRQSLVDNLSSLRDRLQEAEDLITGCDQTFTPEMAGDLSDELEDMFGYAGDELVSEMLSSCQIALNLIIQVSPDADVKELASQVPDLQAKWQDLFQRRSACTSLAEFHMKKTLLSDILDGQSRRLDQADALTGVEDELQEEIERLEVQFSDSCAESQDAVDCLAALEELLENAPPAHKESLRECLQVTEERHATVLNRASESLERLRHLHSIMHSHNRKLEELRQLVEHLEEQVKSFGALLDSVDDARFAEQDILATENRWNSAHQLATCLQEDDRANSTLVQLQTCLTIVSSKLTGERDRLQSFSALWEVRHVCCKSLHSLHGSIQSPLKGLSELPTWRTLFTALKIMLEAHSDSVDGIQDAFHQLLSHDNDLLEYVSEPLANSLSGETQELGKTGDALLSTWQRWKSAHEMWSEVLVQQAFICSCVDCASQHCSGHLLTERSSQDGLKSQLEVCKSKVAYVHDTINGSIGTLIPEHFEDEVQLVSMQLSERFAAVDVLSSEFFAASDQAWLLVSNVEKLSRILQSGFVCLQTQAEVLGPTEAIDEAQRAIKDFFKDDQSLAQIEKTVQSCDDAGTQLLGAICREQLRATQFPEYANIRERLDHLRRKSDSLRSLHTNTVLALQDLGDLWAQLMGSCSELQAYVVQSRQLFPTMQQLESSTNRHQLCSTKLDEMKTSLRTAQRKATVVQGHVGELQNRCDSNNSLCDYLTQRYREVKTFLIILELVSKLLAIIVENGVVQTLVLENESDLQDAALKCQSGSQALAMLRKRLDVFNDNMKVAQGALSQVPNLAEEEKVVRQVVERQATALTRLRTMWAAANKLLAEVENWTKKSCTEINDLPIEAAVEMSDCSDNLGRVQGLLSQHKHHKARMEGLGTQLGQIAANAPAAEAVPKRDPAPRRIDAITEEGEDEEDGEVAATPPRSDIDALCQRYAAANKALDSLLQKLESGESQCRRKMERWSVLWNGMAKLDECCDKVDRELSQLNVSNLQTSQFTAAIDLVQQLQSTLAAFEDIVTSLENLVQDNLGGSQSERLRSAVERRRTLLDRLQALETQLKHLAATVVNYRAKVRGVEAGNRKLGQDHSVLCQPIADWGDIGERLANIQALHGKVGGWQRELDELQALFDVLRQHFAGNATANTRQDQCCVQYSELSANVLHSIRVVERCLETYDTFQRGMASLRQVLVRCDHVKQQMHVQSLGESQLEAGLQELAAVGQELRDTASSDRELVNAIRALDESPVQHQPESIRKLQQMVDQCHADRESQLADFAALDQEWHGVAKSMPRLQEVLEIARDKLVALCYVTDMFVPVGVDVDEQGEVFVKDLSEAYHDVMETNRQLQALTTSMPGKVSQVLNFSERLRQHWLTWTELEAKAESCRVELTENQEKWRCHHHDLELLQQWTSGVLSNVRTLRMSSLSSRQRLTATRLELQVLLSQSWNSDTCVIQAALADQLLAEATEFCDRAPLSIRNELHGQEVVEACQEVATVTREAEALYALTEARARFLGKLEEFTGILLALEEAAATCTARRGTTGSRQASIVCLQGISSKLPGLQATLAELVAEADGIEIGGFLEEQLQSAQDRQRTLCQLVTGPPQSLPTANGGHSSLVGRALPAFFLHTFTGSRVEFLALILLLAMIVVVYFGSRALS